LPNRVRIRLRDLIVCLANLCYKSHAMKSYHNLPLRPGGFIVCPCTGQSFHDLVRYHNHTKDVVHTRYVDEVKTLVPTSEPVINCDLCHTSVGGATEWGNYNESAARRAAADWLNRIEFRTHYMGFPENFCHPFLKTWDAEIPELPFVLRRWTRRTRLSALSHPKQ
jgi:hypothetical protein